MTCHVVLRHGPSGVLFGCVPLMIMIEGCFRGQILQRLTTGVLQPGVWQAQGGDQHPVRPL